MEKLITESSKHYTVWVVSDLKNIEVTTSWSSPKNCRGPTSEGWSHLQVSLFWTEMIKWFKFKARMKIIFQNWVNFNNTTQIVKIPIPVVKQQFDLKSTMCQLWSQVWSWERWGNGLGSTQPLPALITHNVMGPTHLTLTPRHQSLRF